MTIRVLGGGCKSCKKLYETVLSAAKEMKLDAEVLYITDMAEIAKTGVMSMPVLEIDGQVKTAGKVPSKPEVLKLLANEPSCKV